jgi:competence protein ComEC
LPESETGGTNESASLKLDLNPPLRLDLWAITFSLGIVLGTVTPPLGVAFVLAACVVSAAALYRWDIVGANWRMMAVLAPLFAAGGLGIASLHLNTPDPLAQLANMQPGEVTVVGVISSPPIRGDFGYRADLQLEHLWHEEQEVLRGGGLQVFAGDLSVGVGDKVRVDGEITSPEPGENDFDYGRYLSTKGISAIMYANEVVRVDDRLGWIGRVHRRTDVSLSYGLRPKEASIVRGMVLGDRSRMPEELEEDFRRSGITHILAISGQHVAILAALVYFVLRGFGVPFMMTNPATLGVIWLYILVAGAPPSAVRAGVVATFVLAAPLFGRQLSPLHFMTTMLAFVLAYNPDLIYSTGFQLSVAAVFGILLLRKPLLALLRVTLFRPFKEPPDLLANLISISLAAQIATAPIIASTFEEVPVLGVFTNLIAVPLSGPILALGMLASLTGNVLPTLAYPINFSNGFLVTILEWVAQGVSALPFAVVGTSSVPLVLVGVFYLGCLPAIVSESLLPEERWPFWAGTLLVWAVLWLTLASVVSG